MKRVVTALFLVPVCIYSALFAPWWFFFAILALVAMLCMREWAQITGSFAPLGYLAGILILFAPQHELLVLFVASALAALSLQLPAPNSEKGFARAAALVLGIVYIFGSWKTGILLHDSSEKLAAFGVPAGHHLLMFGLMVNWIGDTGAYYVGRNFGRHKMAPAISPGKSWEGAAASAITGVVFGLIYLPLAIRGTSPIVAGLLALAANVAGQVGDLAESAVKRGAGVKDSGTLLPGHGGMMDRVDSSMFALPVLYALSTLLG